MPSGARPATAFQPRTRVAPEIASGELPPGVREALESPGGPLDTESRGFFEPRFGHDFSRVRVHIEPPAAESARSMGARAYTVGSSIVFGPGQYQPQTRHGRELLAHELAHVVQSRSDGGPQAIRRQTAPPATGAIALEDQAQRPASKEIIREVQQRTDPDASGTGDFAAAYRTLNGLAMFDMLATLDELRRLGIFDLLQGSTDLAVGVGRSRIEVAMAAVRAHGTMTGDAFAASQADAFSTLPLEQRTDITTFLASPVAPMPEQGPTTPHTRTVAELSAEEKLSKAFEYAKGRRDAAWDAAVDGLKSPQSLVTIAFVAAAFVAAQSIPVVWIADAAALAGLAVAGFFTGVSAATFVIDIGKFFAALNAQSDEDLMAAGQALADAVAIFGIFTITGALTEGVASGIGGKSTPLGPPPSGYVDAYARGHGIIRVPNEMVPPESPTFPTRMHAEGEGGGGPSEPPGATPPQKAPDDEQAATDRAARIAKLKADLTARRRSQQLTNAYEEAEAKAKASGMSSALDDLSPDNRTFVEQSPRNKELAYDPAHRGWTDGSVTEAKAMLDGEARGIIDGPVTRNLDNTSDFNTPKGEIDHFGPKGLDPQADADALVRKLTDKSYDVYLDSSAIDLPAEQALVNAARQELGKVGKLDSIKRVISSRQGRLAP